MSVLPDKNTLEVQSGFPGSGVYKIVLMADEKSAVSMDAPGGGEITYTYHYATDYGDNERQVEIGARQTGTPGRFTFNLNLPYWLDRAVIQALEDLGGTVSQFQVRHYTGSYEVLTNYARIQRYSNARLLLQDSGRFSDPLFNKEEKQQGIAKYVLPYEATGYYEIWPVALADIKGAVTTLGITDIISFGTRRGAGDVVGEDANNDGTKEYIAVTLQDVSNLPHLRWTNDKGANWADVTLTGMTNGDASGVALVGANVVVSMIGAGGGLAWANWEAVKAGTATWTRSTNISAGTVINAVKRITATKCIAVGPSGTVHVSSDSGVTFVSAGAAVTANALTKIVVASETLQWLGGASSTLVRRDNDVMSPITVTGLAAAINSLTVPNGLERNNQLFIGDAAGKIYATLNGRATAPAFATRYNAGSGAIDALAFAGPNGGVLWFVHTNGSTQSRVFRDLNGGILQSNGIEAVSEYTAPANASFNAIAAPKSSANVLMVVGDVTGGQGFIGRVA